MMKLEEQLSKSKIKPTHSNLMIFILRFLEIISLNNVKLKYEELKKYRNLSINIGNTLYLSFSFIKEDVVVNLE